MADSYDPRSVTQQRRRERSPHRNREPDHQGFQGRGYQAGQENRSSGRYEDRGDHHESGYHAQDGSGYSGHGGPYQSHRQNYRDRGYSHPDHENYYPNQDRGYHAAPRGERYEQGNYNPRHHQQNRYDPRYDPRDVRFNRNRGQQGYEGRGYTQNLYDKEAKKLAEKQKKEKVLKEGTENEEEDIMAMMGMSGFGTSKNKKVKTNYQKEATGSNKTEARQYRQYMNRKGGFNRPLDAVR